MKQYLEVSAAPAWEFISDVRRFVALFCVRVMGDEDFASRVSVAVHELLENAVRYATSDEGSLRVEISPDDGTVVVTVRNETSPLHVERLRAAVERLEGADPDEVYQQHLRRQSTASATDPGLGLSRIRAESDMSVSLQVERPSIICLTARGTTR